MHDGEAIAPVTPAYSAEGVQLLRTTTQIQYQLSQMADMKANMLLGITFLIFTVAVGQARSGHQEIALLILAGAAFGAAVLAVLAVLPSMHGLKTPTGVSGMVFFGSFTKLDEDDYVDRLTAIAGDAHKVYETFSRDIYAHGMMLSKRKYRLLEAAYRVLLTGLICSLVAFLILDAPKMLNLGS